MKKSKYLFFYLIWIFAFGVSCHSLSSNKIPLRSFIDKGTSSNREIEKTKVVSVDPDQIDFPADRVDPRTLLWKENELLSAREFYEKYESDFVSWNVNLDFSFDQVLSVGKDRYERYQWESDLERDLSFLSQDHYKAKVIARAYLKNIYPLIKEVGSLKSQFEWILCKYYLYLGSDQASFRRKMALYGEFQPFFQNPKYINKLSLFLESVKGAFPKSKPKENGPIKVAIITGPYGGGHVSTASVLESALQSDERFKVLKIDECTDFPDTLYRLTGYHSCRIYNDIFVSEGNDRKAALFWILNSKLADFVPPNKNHALYEKLKNENVDFIISTVHHIEEITGNSYLLDIPIRIVVTDYEFPQKQWFHLNHVDSDLVRYWIPTEEYTNFFRSIVDTYSLHHWDTKLPNSRTRLLQQYLFIDQEPMKLVLDKLGVFEYLPFPVSPKIRPANSLEESQQSRKSLGLSLNRKIVTISQGGSPNVDLFGNVTDQVVQAVLPLHVPVQIAVVAAGKQGVAIRAKEVMDRYRIPVIEEPSEDGLSSFAKVTCKILGYLKYPDEMSELYQASDVVVTKAGGASTAELSKTLTPFVRGFALWPWEIQNAKYLEYLGLSFARRSIGTPSAIRKPSDGAIEAYSREVDVSELHDELKQALSLNTRIKPQVDLFSEKALKDLILQGVTQWSQVQAKWRESQGSLRQFIKLGDQGVFDSEVNKTRRFRFLSHEAVAAGRVAQLFMVEDIEDSSAWLLKRAFATDASLDREHQGLLAIRKILPHAAPRSFLLDNTTLVKEVVFGKTLFEMLRDNQMTPESEESLFQLFKTFCEKNIYVKDLQGFNLIYSDDKNWVVIDTNGVEHHSRPKEAYLQELSEHWERELEENYSNVKEKAFDSETRKRLARISEILLDRLKKEIL